MEIISRNLPGKTEEYCEKSLDSLHLGQDLKPVPAGVTDGKYICKGNTRTRRSDESTSK